MPHPGSNPVKGQAGDQLPEEDENNDRGVHFDDNKNVDGDNNVEDDNNDGDGAVPLAFNITPQFNSKDLYKVLGVPMNATERQIKSAYFNLAKKHHPDRQPIHLSKDDANRTFSFINNAYEILGDTEKRRVHDASLRIGEVINVDEEGNDNEERDDDNNSDDDDGRNVDENTPPEKYRSLFPCDWQNVNNFCHTPQLQPYKCQTDGCNKWVHLICQRSFEINNGHRVTSIPKCCMHHPHSPFTATKPSTPNVEGEQQPEHVSINTSSSESSSSSKSSESSSSSSSSKIPTRKGRVCSVSGKAEAIQARMQAQRENELFSNSSSDDDSSDSNAAQPKTVKGWGRKLHAGRILLFSIGLECYLQPKTGQTIPYQEDSTLILRITIFSPVLLTTNSQKTCVD